IQSTVGSLHQRLQSAATADQRSAAPDQQAAGSDQEFEETGLPGSSERRYLQTGDEAMKNNLPSQCMSIWWFLVLIVLCAQIAPAQGTAFTYQGKLNDGGNPANGQYDFQFSLYDALTGGAQQGSTVTVTNVTVTAGSFTVQLDFGACQTA